MKNIVVINLDKYSLEIASSLQEFYGDKAKVSVIELIDEPSNVDIFFIRGTSIFKVNTKNTIKELVRNNKGCRVVAYYENQGEGGLIFESNLSARFSTNGEGFHTDYKISKGNILLRTWNDAKELLELLEPKEEFHFESAPDKEWAEY